MALPTEAAPRPPAVEARQGRCPPGRLGALPGGDEFQPVERGEHGVSRVIPLDAGDAELVHRALAAITVFTQESYAALRTIPADDSVAGPPPKDSWSRGDTAATLRQALAPFRFLGEPNDGMDRRARTPFLREHLAPLLDEQGAVSWLGALRSAPADAAPPWQAPEAGGAAGHFVTTFAPVVREFFDRMSGWYEPPPGTPERAMWRYTFSFAFGIVIIAAAPVRSIYHSFHGTAAIETVETGLAAAGQAAQAMLAESWVDLLGAADPGLPGRYRALMAEVLQFRSLIGCDLYASALAPPDRLRPAQSPKHSGEALETTSKDWPKLGFTTRLDLLSHRPDDAEVYWAHDAAWKRLDLAASYVSQAGFALVLTAANNRWDGKHPPHNTHQNGFDFDLDVLIPLRPREFGDAGGKAAFRAVADLAQMQLIPSKKGVILNDKGESFTMVPVNPRDPRPTTQTLLDRLAIWVVLQALQLVGMDDVLYADFANMDLAARHVAGRFLVSPPRPVAMPGGKLPPRGQVRQLLDPAGHYNHLHAECPRDLVAVPSSPPDFTRQRSWPTLNGSLIDWAKARDADPRFLELMFGPDGAAPPEETRYREDWTGRWKEDGPSLLPVWDPTIR
jgi:hypothetical protein